MAYLLAPRVNWVPLQHPGYAAYSQPYTQLSVIPPVDTADPTSSIELSQQAGPATPTPATLPEFVRPNALREPRREDGLGSTDPDLSLLSRAEQESIESACRDARLEQGPAAYGQCLTDLLTRLANGPARPDLSLLSRIELASIEAACNSARLAQGPAAYNQCLTDLLADLANTPPRPDLSLLIRAERDAIESACRHARLAQGPAAYNQCLADQLATLDR